MISSYEEWRTARKALPVRVYVISGGEHVKVGISADPDARLRDLQVGNPLRLSVKFASRPVRREFAERIERVAHSRLKPFKVSGEWFGCSVRDAVMALRA